MKYLITMKICTGLNRIIVGYYWMRNNIILFSGWSHTPMYIYVIYIANSKWRWDVYFLCMYMDIERPVKVHQVIFRQKWTNS